MSSITSLNNQLSRMQTETNKANFERNRERVGESNLDRDGFFQLLLTQLQHQDPMEPQDGTEQMMQQAQFTQIEELQKLNANLTQNNMMSTASSYVGKEVTYTFEGQNKRGVIEKASFSDDGVGLHIGDDLITPEQVTAIMAQQATGG